MPMLVYLPMVAVCKPNTSSRYTGRHTIRTLMTYSFAQLSMANRLYQMSPVTSKEYSPLPTLPSANAVLC